QEIVIKLRQVEVLQSQGMVVTDDIRQIGVSEVTYYSVLSATIHPDIKRTLVSMSKRTGMTVSQVTDEVLYTGLLEMQELDDRG
ncbi:MAG TPA: hypothetical protein QF698_10085, partial [Candidatus Marinimicrobia bacterium]|nr:hypothetical protein [Candidatus Neomarinimicrobiota bacterium]